MKLVTTGLSGGNDCGLGLTMVVTGLKALALERFQTFFGGPQVLCLPQQGSGQSWGSAKGEATPGVPPSR